MKSEMIDSDQEWQAKNDARTLIDAEAIKADPKKLKKALAAAKKISAEKQDEAKAAKKVASPKKEMSLIDDEETN